VRCLDLSVEYAEIGELKEGSYVVIDGEPCRIVEITKAKTGKHGSAKVHLVALSILSGAKKTLVAPADQRVEIPIVNKKTAQVIAVLGDKVQLMDTESYETFEVELPKEQEITGRIKTGSEVEYWEVLGVRKIMRVLRS
jgi:translation initiation factor 5A (eIF-5A)